MASEHKHEWQAFSPGYGDTIIKTCRICGREETEQFTSKPDKKDKRIKELEQQLAQARALLEAMPEPVYKSDNDNWICTCCEAVYPDRLRRGPFRHQDACPWRKIRAFLAASSTS